MRIMIDTNVLLSSFLFPSPIMNAFINLVIDQHRIVLSSYIIDELNAVVAKKFPAKHNLVRHFLKSCPMNYSTERLILIKPYTHLYGTQKICPYW